MSRRFEELDWQETPLGEISLRRRIERSLDVEVFEVKLGEEFLMSSLFTVAEIELARLGLAEAHLPSLDVLVGGLGLGYTAAETLRDSRVASLTVIEALPPVIGWHERDLLPDTVGLAADSRTRLVQGDFFALAAGAEGFGPGTPERYDVILLDVDHTPRHVLHPSHAPFYTTEGLTALQRHLRPGGVFALWSDDPPDRDFMQTLLGCFAEARAEPVEFPNPLTGGTSANTVYVAASRS